MRPTFPHIEYLDIIGRVDSWAHFKYTTQTEFLFLEICKKVFKLFIYY